MQAFLVALLLAGMPLVPTNAPSCAGADPAIVSAIVESTAQVGHLNRYTIGVTVQNMGTMKQASNLLQSVAVFQDGTKVDQKGLQPLARGASQIVMYSFNRSRGAAPRTTHLRFVLTFKGTAVPGNADCDTGNDEFRLAV